MVHISSDSGINSKDITAIFNEVGANSKKIAVTTRDGVTQCYVEIERWIENTDESESSSSSLEGREAWLWVRIPYIRHREDEIIYLYYDGSHADNNTYVGTVGSTPGQSVWTSKYKAVFHLSEGGTGTRYDSTEYNNDGTPYGYTGIEATSAGKIDGTDKLGTGKDIPVSTGDNLRFASTDSFTETIWFKIAAFDTGLDQVFFKHERNHLYLESTDSWRVRSFLGAVSTDSTWAPSLNVWYMATLTYNNTSLKIYIDDDFVIGSTRTLESQAASTLSIGLNTRPINGWVDEFRVTNTALTLPEIKANYNSGNDSLLIFGDPEQESSSSS